MKLEYFILGLLKMKPRTGYEIKAFLDNEGRFARPETPLSQIYTTLKRMAGDKWVEFEEVLRVGKPDLKIYSPTAKGDKVLREWLSAPHKPSLIFQDREFLGKMVFSSFIDKKTVLQHCYTELTYRKEQIIKFRNRDLTLQITPAAGIPQARAQMMVNLVSEYGKESLELYIAWLEGFIQKLKNQPD